MADSISDSTAKPFWGDYTPGTETSKIQKSTSSSSKSNDLDKNAFLNLLMTQLKYQDPTNPTDDKEFLAQMAQFSSLEQMQNLNQNMANSQSYSLVGKSVKGQNYVDATNSYIDVSGVVSSVTIKNGTAWLTVGKKQLRASEVTDVGTDTQSEILNSVNNNLVNTQSLGLVGKYIQALTTDNSGNVTGFIEGKVDYIKFNNGTPELMVNNQVVLPSEVVNVADQKLLIGKDIKTVSTDADNPGLTNNTITDVTISGSNAYVVLNGNQKVQISKIDVLTAALNSIGKSAQTTDTTGKISDVILNSQEPYVVINGNQYKFSNVKTLG